MIAQFLLNRILSLTPTGYWSRIRLAFWNLTRTTIVKLYDPLIQCDVRGTTIHAPLSHNLPLNLKLFPNYASNLGRIAKAVKQKYHDFSCVDIGANIGDSIAVLRREADFPLLCIEGQEDFWPILELNSKMFPDVELEKAFVGDRTESIHAAITRHLGSAEVVPDDDSSGLVEMKRLIEILNARPRFSHLKLVKIDTDGFDCIIIRSSSDVLSKWRPVLFFEYDPYLLAKHGDDGISVFATLRNTGYAGILVYDRTGEFMYSASTTDYRILEEMHTYFSDPDGGRHCDICAFHQEDLDLFEKTRVEELGLFRQLHKVGSPRSGAGSSAGVTRQAPSSPPVPVDPDGNSAHLRNTK
jgi:FkbM family methyltransferase